jgi:murein DD-endopeptidase MepM/ murein hydrolase activator NlpD
VLFTAESFGDLLKRGYFLSVMVQAEKRLVESVREQREAVEAQKKEIEERQAEIAAVRREKEGQKRHIQELRGGQQAEVTRIRGQRQSYEAAARELEASATRVQKFLADFEARRQRAQREGKKDEVEIQLDKNNFGANRGRLPWPTQGTVIGNFGLETDPQWGTQVRNNGVDIRAEDGAPVKAVADGRVEMTDWLPGYGQSVILNHGQGYYSVYAHLGSDNVQVGGRVTAGRPSAPWAIRVRSRAPACTSKSAAGARRRTGALAALAARPGAHHSSVAQHAPVPPHRQKSPHEDHVLGRRARVTGSRHLVQANGSNVLLDCGLFQGRRDESEARTATSASTPNRWTPWCSPTPTSTTRARCPCWPTRATAAACTAPGPPPISAASCCWTAHTSRRRT